VDQYVPLVIGRSRSTPMGISGGTGLSIGATSGRLTRRKLAVRQPFDTTCREKPVPVEHLVEFTSAVSVAPPQRSKDWSRSRGCEDAVEILRCRGIESDGEDVVHLHSGGEGGHVDHLNELHSRGKDPFEFTDARCTAPPERQGSKTYDESHDLSFCAGAHPPGGDRGRGSVDLCPQHRRVDLDDTPTSTRASWPMRLNSPTSGMPHPTGSSYSS
jgi:hypothetical protein